MKCMSCESEINPQWKHAIEINVCPFCGQNILPEQLKDLFSDLRSTMDALLEYPDQLNDWMLSNYNYIKTDSQNLINYIPKEQLKTEQKSKPKEDSNSEKFIVKVKTDNGEQEVVAQKIQSEERTNSFFKRAEVVKPNIDGFQSAAEKTERLKIMAKQIKKAGMSSGMPLITADENGNISNESLENIDPDSLEGAIDDGLGNISSVLSSEDDEIPDVVRNMAKNNSGKNNNSNMKDLLYLQQMQDRVNNSKRNFESGENRGKGSFGRSG